MIASLTVLIAASSMTSCAFRLQWSPAIAPRSTPGRMMQQDVIRPSVSLPHLQMQEAEWMGRGARRNATARAQLREARRAYETNQQQPLQQPREKHQQQAEEEATAAAAVPKKASAPLPSSAPTQLQDAPPASPSDTLPASQVLRDWAASLVDPGTSATIASPRPDDQTDMSHAGDLTIPLFDPVISYFPIIHAVGLVSKENEIPFLLSGSSAGDTYVEAFGAFVRDHLQDDRRGSLRNRIKEMYGTVQGKLWIQTWWGDANEPVPVLKIGGLMAAPGFEDASARVLLSEINDYASKERRIVVLSKRACTSKDGVDLTDYYVRLGFERVMMEEGRHELVYMRMGASPRADMWADSEQIMVGMDVEQALEAV